MRERELVGVCSSVEANLYIMVILCQGICTDSLLSNKSFDGSFKNTADFMSIFVLLFVADHLEQHYIYQKCIE